MLPSDVPATVRSALARHAGEPGALLPILHDVQDALGYIPPDAVPITYGSASGLWNTPW